MSLPGKEWEEGHRVTEKRFFHAPLSVALLFLAAPFLAEVLPGVNPPAELMRQPGAVLPLVVLYGSGAVLARELTVRWKGGYPTLLLLSAAYGVLEEGLLVRSFFDPAWLKWPALAGYGRWLGVNLVWALHLTLYHAVFSIAIPVTLVQRGRAWPLERPWLGPWGWWLVGGLYLLRLGLGWRSDSLYRASAFHVAGVLVVTALLAFWARRVASFPRKPRGQQVPRKAPAPWRLSLWALGTSTLFFVVSWGLPLWGVPAWVVVPVLLGLAMGAFAFLAAWGRRGGWGPRHRFALASGGVLFFVLLAWLQEWRPDPAASRQGMALLGLLTALILFWAYRGLPAREPGAL